jgi:hypothetical protein
LLVCFAGDRKDTAAPVMSTIAPPQAGAHRQAALIRRESLRKADCQRAPATVAAANK